MSVEPALATTRVGCKLRELASTWVRGQFSSAEEVSYLDIVAGASDPMRVPSEPAFAFAGRWGMAWVVDYEMNGLWDLSVSFDYGANCVGSVVSGGAAIYYLVHEGEEIWPSIRELDSLEGVDADSLNIQVVELAGCSCAWG